MSNDVETPDADPTADEQEVEESTSSAPQDTVVSTADGGTTDDASEDEASGDDSGDDDSEDDDASGDDSEDDGDPLVREGDVAGDYLERLLDILDLDGDIDLDVEGERAIVGVVGGELRHLVGPNGQTLDALQELTRLAVTTQTGSRSRLMLDIDGYRQNRREQLSDLAASVSDTVRSTGESQELKAMNPFERKVVHDAVAAIAGVMSESTGEEPSRRVVILPSSA